jgi:mRNA interferase MazF
VTFDAGEVVVVPFPFTDRAAEKRRPALVLSSASAFGNRARHSVMAMITSAKDGAARWPLDVAITDLRAAGLPVASIVRMKLFTLDHRLIVRRVGRLSTGDRAGVSAAIEKLFGVGGR